MKNIGRNTVPIFIAALLTPAIWQAQDRVEPTFSITIENKTSSAEQTRGTHHIEVRYTNTSGVPQKDACAVSTTAYEMTAWRDGVPLEKHPAIKYPNFPPGADTNHPELSDPFYFEKRRCHGINEPIQPGKSVTFPMWANAEYDMTVPGTYVIQVSRETDRWHPDKSVTVKSNSITIVVPAPEASPSNKP